MKAVIVIAVLALVALAIAAPVKDASWRLYKHKFNKHYVSAEEEAQRYAVFKKNMRRVLELNQVDSARHSWSKFSDMEHSEIATPMVVPKNIVRTKLVPTNDLPESYDLRTLGHVNAVKDQGQCGSCWAFCATASMESANFLKTGSLFSLSEQQLVDCDTDDSGCGGGWPQRGMDFIKANGGQELEADYSYTASSGKCKAQKAMSKGTVSQTYSYESTEEAIMEALMQHGVVAIAIDASKFDSYNSGIMNGKGCQQGSPDHGVAIVGWGVDKGTKYWIVRNSWGQAWGEAGYVRVQRGINACGVEDYPQGCDA